MVTLLLTYLLYSPSQELAGSFNSFADSFNSFAGSFNSFAEADRLLNPTFRISKTDFSGKVFSEKLLKISLFLKTSNRVVFAK